MSWAAHEFENYFIQKHVGLKASFLAIVLGASIPDLFTKGLVYASDDAAQFHRGWPGVGFTHSLLFGVVFATAVLAVTRSRNWALGVLIGQWAHVLTDVADTAGIMLFFPFSTEPVTISMWKHAASEGRYGDAAAYYSGLGGVWDLFWLVMVIVFAHRTLRYSYFRDVIVPADPGVWSWMSRTLRLPDHALLLIYRGVLFYGLARALAWFMYARFDAQDAAPARVGRARVRRGQRSLGRGVARGRRAHLDRRRAVRRLPLARLAAGDPSPVGAGLRPAAHRPRVGCEGGVRGPPARPGVGRGNGAAVREYPGAERVNGGMPRMLLPLALAAAALAMTATVAGAAVVPDIQDRVLTVTGDDAADRITLRIPAASPASLEIDLEDDGTADFRIPRTRFDAVRVVAGGGDDRVRIDDGGTRFPLTVPTTVFGGAGNDALTGGRSAETLLAGDGADKVAGGGGADVVDLGAGDDRYDWRAADGNDDVDGGAGSDLVLADGTDADDRLTFSAAGPRARIAGDSTALGAAGVERVDVNARSGSDVITIGDLTGTVVQQVEPNLSLGLTDAGADRVVLAGTAANDFVNVFPNGLGSALVVGTHAVVRVRHADPARDELTVQGGAGRDNLDGGGGELPMALVLDGGDGDDQLSGSAGADTLNSAARGTTSPPTARGRRRAPRRRERHLRREPGRRRRRRPRRRRDRPDLAQRLLPGEQFEVAAAGQGARITVGATAIATPGGVERVDLLSFGGSDRIAVRDRAARA